MAKKRLLAFVALAVFASLAAIFFLTQRPASAFDGKPASTLLSQLTGAGFCAEPYQRDYFDKDLDYLAKFDADTVRACADSQNGGLVYMLTGFTPADLFELRQSTKGRSAFGKDWMVVCLSGGDKRSFVEQIAERFDGKVEKN